MCGLSMEAAMTANRIDLVWERGCPNADAARSVVRQALGEAGLEPQWTEWEIGADELPAFARGFGSPTILVDQHDVAGLAGGGSDDACRIYLDDGEMSGVPSVETVVRRLLGDATGPPSLDAGGTKTDVAVSAGAAVAAVAAILSSACCWLPLLLIGFGVSAGGVAALFEAYRAPLLIGTGLLLSTAFYFAYRPQPACGRGGSCATPKRRLVKMNRFILWSATVLVVGFASFPGWMHLVVGSSGAGAAAGETETREVRYAVEGMHCAGCKGLLETELMRLPGVVTADVSYEQKSALVWVRSDAHVSDDAVAQAGQAVGFEVRPREAP